MAQFLFGKQLTASLSALARLGVADHMGDTTISADELAGKVGAHAPSLFRVMRMLASFGVFSQEPGGKFALTPLGALLRTDVPGSMRYMAMMLGDEPSMRAYVHMADCIRTGQDGITMAYGKPIFDLFAERPEQAETFQRAMSGGSAIAAQSILASYDFPGSSVLPILAEGTGSCLPRSCKNTLRCRVCCSIFPRWSLACRRIVSPPAAAACASRLEASSSACRKGATPI